MKRFVSLLLTLTIVFMAFAVFEPIKADAATGNALVDYALSCEGKYLSDFPQTNVYYTLEDAWCCWFTTFCASQVGLCGTPSNHTSGLFAPIEMSTWGSTSPNYAATNQSYQAGWMTQHNKGVLYYASMCTSGRCGTNSNTINIAHSSFSPKTGDLIYFDWGLDGWWDHVAIVVSNSGGVVTYVGGNQGNASRVTVNTISTTSSQIAGYLRPNYGYLSKCTPYESYCTVKTTDSCPLWNMPCSDKTDSSATKLTTISSGTTLTATALYKNTADNYWYKVTYNGTSGYVYAGNTSFIKQLTSDAKITGEESPASLNVGQAFPIGGTVSTSYNKLMQVGGFIFKNGVQKISANKEYGKFVDASSNSYSLKGSAIDNELAFNKLAAGTYYYMIQLCIRSYYSTDGTNIKSADYWPTLVDKQFTVGSTHSHSYTLKTNDEYSWYECSCGDTYGKTAHTYGGWSVVTEPSCTEPGLKRQKCPACYHEQTQTIPALGHNYYSTITSYPSCSEEGVRTYTCTRCNHSYTETIPKTQHNYIKTETVPASCITGKYISHICECGASTREIIGPATGHTWNAAGICSDCGISKTWILGDINCDGKLVVNDIAILNNYILSSSGPYDAFFDVDANGVLDENDVNVAYDLLKSKLELYDVSLNSNGGTCTVKSMTVYDNGRYGEMPVPTREGYVFDGWYSTPEGGEKINFGDAHQNANHMLYAHWIKESSGIIGDLTGDGDITSADSVMLSRYLAGLTVLSDEQLTAADINNDGDVTSADSVLLARFLAGIVTSIE